MDSPKFSSSILLCLLFLTFQSHVGVSTAQNSSPVPPDSPCPSRCRRARLFAQRDCNRVRGPSSCQVAPCPSRAGLSKTGFACIPNPTPAVPPSADFTSRTFMRGGPPLVDSRIEPATDGSGVMYDISYNMTITDNGIVSLNAVSDLVTIECNIDGSVRIRLSDDISVPDLDQMFPESAILVIGRELFGECNLAEEVEIPDETDDDAAFRTAGETAALFTDAYLIIESVTGSSRDAIVRGTPTTFFALFDTAEISIIPTLPQTESSSSRQLLPVSARTVNIAIPSNVLSVDPVTLTVTGNGQFNGEYISFIASWSIFSVNVEFKFINQWELSVSLDAAFSAGVSRDATAVTLLSVPLYGLPPINLLANLNLPFMLPNFRLGLFFEVPVIVRADAMLESSFENAAQARYSTTRTEVTMFLRGTFLNLDIGADTRTLAPSSQNFEFVPSVSFTAETAVTVSAFAGIRPQFVAHIPILSGRVSVEVGVQVEGNNLPGVENAFPPLTGGGTQFGICEDCHDLEITGSGRIQNAGIFIRNVGITLPGNPAFSADIATGCFVEPIGDDGPLNFIAETSVCESCPEEMPVYNPTRQECEGECLDPDMPFFNQATEECEACPDDVPTFNEDLEICEANCPGGTGAGNNVPFFGSFELGSPSGVFNFQRQHFTIRDRMEVLYEGAVIHDTGCTGGSESIDLSYSGTATNVVVRVTPNCAGTSGTAWNFAVSCPA